jgi:hypothetical protein
MNSSFLFIIDVVSYKTLFMLMHQTIDPREKQEADETLNVKDGLNEFFTDKDEQYEEGVSAEEEFADDIDNDDE